MTYKHLESDARVAPAFEMPIFVFVRTHLAVMVDSGGVLLWHLSECAYRLKLN